MDLIDGIAMTALAFRGYDVQNLGRTAELLNVPAYRPLMIPYFHEAAAAHEEFTGKRVDLIGRIEAGQETTLEEYGEAIAIIVAAEMAQLDLLKTCHGVDYHHAALSFGFSLGEIAALVAGGSLALKDALKIPLTMAKDGVELARDVRLGIVFVRRAELPIAKLREILLHVNNLGQGVIGISTHLSPNSALVMGTGQTLDLLRQRMGELGVPGVHLKVNEERWPPLHTPIVWEKDINSRAARLMHTMPGGFAAPRPPVLSLVTGKISYDQHNLREHMIRWIDHTQLLWDAIYELMNRPVTTVLHVGPAPNIIPATLDRLAANVEAQTKGSRRMRALSSVIYRPWLKHVLPRRTALLRAPLIKQVVLENWLLENIPTESTTTSAMTTTSTVMTGTSTSGATPTAPGVALPPVLPIPVDSTDPSLPDVPAEPDVTTQADVTPPIVPTQTGPAQTGPAQTESGTARSSPSALRKDNGPLSRDEFQSL